MSEFSKRCRFLIDICETNVYQIAKRTGLDRTTLQKMVQGTRLPSQQFVEQFCDYLAINISDREELLRLFKIEKIGINVWARRQEVESLLRDFPMLRKKLEESSSYRLFSLEQSYEGSRCCSRRLSTSAEVIDAIRYVIMSISRCAAKGGVQEEKCSIYMDSFPRLSFAMQEILREERIGQVNLSCCQFLNVCHRGDSAGGQSKSVQMLRTILPFAFALRGNFRVCCFYRETNEPDLTQIWPHYLVTQEMVLLMTEEADRGLLIDEPMIAAEYYARLENMQIEGKDLFLYRNGFEAVLQLYADQVASEGMLLSFDTTPCPADFFMPYLAKEADQLQGIRRTYAELLRRKHNSRFLDDAYKGYICLNGMEKFVSSGILPGVIGGLIGAVDAELRPQILREYADKMRERGDEYVVKDELQFPKEGLNLELYRPNRIFLYSNRDDEAFGCIYMEETGLFQAFLDYFESLEEENKVSSAEESYIRYTERTEEILRNVPCNAVDK